MSNWAAEVPNLHWRRIASSRSASRRKSADGAKPEPRRQLRAYYELRAAAGEDVHGEANFVMRYSPGSVLDAGCGTGRVGRELNRRGIDVVGGDSDGEMLATARDRCSSASWMEADLSEIQLGRAFDVVLMAGNVINFVIPELRGQVVENLVRHLSPGGLLINGHAVRPDGCPPAMFAAWAGAAGLELVEHWSTWDRDVYTEGSDWSLTVHRLGR